MPAPPPPNLPDPAPGSPPEDRAELSLVRRIKTGDAGAEAWRDLLTRYQDRLYAVCLRMVGNRDTAADLCQDAMVKILQGLSSFDEQSKLSTWMIRVTMNTCLTHLRAAKHRKHASLSSAEPDSDSDRHSGPAWEPAAASGVQQEGHRTLLQALSQIDPEQRAILVLRDVRGLDYDQIAHVLGVAEGTVKSRLFRARAALRQEMESLEQARKRPTGAS